MGTQVGSLERVTPARRLESGLEPSPCALAPDLRVTFLLAWRPLPLWKTSRPCHTSEAVSYA